MDNEKDKRVANLWEQWAHFRFSVVGSLLARPPDQGQIGKELKKLSEQQWMDPITGKWKRFGFSTIERWYYQVKNEKEDPVGKLIRKVRKDSGQHPSMPNELRLALLQQYKDHPKWTYQLHADNLTVVAFDQLRLGKAPSYSSVKRFMKSYGLVPQRIRGPLESPGAQRARLRYETREVRGFESPHVHGLYHADFHHGSRKVLTSSGQWVVPVLLGVLDDRSRLCCHLQWYLAETAENLAHGLCQAFQKRALPRALMTDNGSAMTAAETRLGLKRLSIVDELTLPYSPEQNGKQESFWGQIEGRLMPMLERHDELTLSLLNEATQAWVEMEYNRKVHSEIGQSPLSRYLDGPDVGRHCPPSEKLRQAFTVDYTRTQRRSDGTVSIESTRYEIPNRYRHMQKVHVRYAGWDLSHVWLVDKVTGKILCRIFPVDKERNAQGRRRTLEPIPLVDSPQQPHSETQPGIAPLLKKLMADYAATGLPPAYLPKDERQETEDDNE